MRCGCGSNAWELRAEQPFEICKGIHSAFKFIWHLFSPSFTFRLFHRPWHLVFSSSSSIFLFVFIVCGALHSHRLQIYLTFMAKLILQMDILPANKTENSAWNTFTRITKIQFSEYQIWRRPPESKTFLRMLGPSFSFKQISTLEVAQKLFLIKLKDMQRFGNFRIYIIKCEVVNDDWCS